MKQLLPVRIAPTQLSVCFAPVTLDMCDARWYFATPWSRGMPARTGLLKRQIVVFNAMLRTHLLARLMALTLDV